MKPRLKLSTAGRLSVLSPGCLGWTEREAKVALRRIYGGTIHFADRFRISRDCVFRALNHGKPAAGMAAEVRSLLGLPNGIPKPGAVKLANWHAKRRGAHQ